MDLPQIKKLIKSNGDRVVLIENGEPRLVVMSFQEYERLAESEGGRLPSTHGSVCCRERMKTGNAHEQTAENTPAFAALSAEVTETPEFDTDTGKETEFVPPGSVVSVELPFGRDEVRLEDLPI